MNPGITLATRRSSPRPYTDRDEHRTKSEPNPQGVHTNLETENLTAAETAVIIKTALKSNFPEAKFSVTSKCFAGGSSVNVRWRNGPPENTVKTLVNQYKSAAFDGMIDMKTVRDHFLLPDGSATLAYDPGTQGSTGTHPRVDNSHQLATLPPGTRRVCLGGSWVTCNRQVDNAGPKQNDATKWLYDTQDIPNPTGNPLVDELKGHPVHNYAYRMVYDAAHGETKEQALARIRAENTQSDGG